MSDKFFLIPKAGLVVRDPDNAQPLPPEGAEKPQTAYWFRRLMDGDVQERAADTAATDIPVSTDTSASVRIKNKPTKE